MTPPPIEAVLWDLDGTLVDSEPLHRQSILETLDALGVEARRLEPKDFVGLGERDFWTLARERFALAESVAQLVDRKDTRYGELARSGLRPMPGANGCLERFAAAGLPMAVASGSSPRSVAAAVAAVGFGRFFRHLVSSLDPDVPRSKPHPDVFLVAAGKLGVAPERCLVVEDAEWGVKAARAAGMRVVVVPNAWTLDHDVSGADWRLASLAELELSALQR